MNLKVLKFEASWCGPCQMLKPVMEKIKASTPDVEFQTIDIEEEPELAASMSVRAVPTLAFVKDGKLVDVIVGLQKEQFIVDTINKWK